MNRLLTIAVPMLALVAVACDQRSSPASPTRPTAVAPPPTATLDGTMTVATSHTATGGVRYTAQIKVTESGGVAATVTRIDLAPSDDWGPYPSFATFGPEAWSDGNVIAANGTLTSKPLVAMEERPPDYFYRLEARITFSEGATAGVRTMPIVADTPPLPQPPPAARFTLTGTVVDFWSGQALDNVTVELLSGENVGRKATTDGEGRYSLSGLKPGSVLIGLSKSGYKWKIHSVDLASNRTVDLILENAF